MRYILVSNVTILRVTCTLIILLTTVLTKQVDCALHSNINHEQWRSMGGDTGAVPQGAKFLGVPS